MDEAKLIEDFTVEELVEELLSRRDGLSDIDTDTLVDELKKRSGVDFTEQECKYSDWVVAIENSEIKTGSGKVRILIVEG